MNCPHCNWFVSKISAQVNRDKEVKNVLGFCKRCGWVHPTNWVYEEFFPPEEGER